MDNRITLFALATIVVYGIGAAACNDSACTTITNEIAACPENMATSSGADDGSQSACVEPQAQCQIDSAIDPCKFTFHKDELNQAEKDKLEICN